MPLLRAPPNVPVTFNPTPVYEKVTELAKAAVERVRSRRANPIFENKRILNPFHEYAGLLLEQQPLGLLS
jgi:hypothetical protein